MSEGNKHAVAEPVPTPDGKAKHARDANDAKAKDDADKKAKDGTDPLVEENPEDEAAAVALTEDPSTPADDGAPVPAV